MAPEQARRRRRYRRFVVAVSIALGIAAGVGVGSVAALARTPTPILLLVFPLAAKLVSFLSGRLAMHDSVVWLWPLIAIPVAGATFYLIPPELAPIALGVVVAAWFLLLIGAGVLEVVLDPDGRLAGNSE